MARGQFAYSGLMASLSARALASLLSGWRDSTTTAAYVALADRIRLLILDGRIPLGTRVPAERDLAAQLGVSRTTVTAAYGELRDSGYVSSVRGSGSVARLPARAPVALDTGHAGYLDFSKATMPALPGLADAAARAAAELPAYLGAAASIPSACRSCVRRSRPATRPADCPPTRSR